MPDLIDLSREQHYAEIEALVAKAEKAIDVRTRANLLGLAQVHATLAAEKAVLARS